MATAQNRYRSNGVVNPVTLLHTHEFDSYTRREVWILNHCLVAPSYNNGDSALITTLLRIHNYMHYRQCKLLEHVE